MEKDLARHIIRSVFRAERELEELLPILKPNLNAQDYEKYARGVAAAIDGINVNLLRRALSDRPELRDEIEQSLEKYDRFL